LNRIQTTNFFLCMACTQYHEIVSLLCGLSFFFMVCVLLRYIIAPEKTEWRYFSYTRGPRCTGLIYIYLFRVSNHSTIIFSLIIIYISLVYDWGRYKYCPSRLFLKPNKNRRISGRLCIGVFRYTMYKMIYTKHNIM